MTKPSAPSPKGRLPVALSAPILQNLTKMLAPMLRSTPPVMTASTWPEVSSSTDALSAAKLEAQAASVMKLGPRRLSTLATRPETMLGSSPGMVSSVMGGRVASMRSCHWPRIASRTAGGSWENSLTDSSARRYSGNWMRMVVM
jgi:hypothetical protein